MAVLKFSNTSWDVRIILSRTHAHKSKLGEWDNRLKGSQWTRILPGIVNATTSDLRGVERVSEQTKGGWHGQKGWLGKHGDRKDKDRGLKISSTFCDISISSHQEVSGGHDTIMSAVAYVLPLSSCFFTPASPQTIIPDPHIQYIPKIKAWQDPPTNTLADSTSH